MASNFELSSGVQAELQCCVCKDTYHDPVTISCGHSLCRECLLQLFTSSSVAKEPYERGERYVPCPTCRAHFHTSHAEIKNMSVNRNLGNIVCAFLESNKDDGTICTKHKKTHVIYCFDCTSLKCLSCFIELCAKKSHSTSEVDELADEMRTSLKAKLKTTDNSLKSLKDSCDIRDSVVTQLSNIVKNQLMQMAKCMSVAECSALAKDVMVCNIDYY